MKKVGILLNSTVCDRYIYETVSKLFESKQIEFFFLMHKKNPNEQESFKDKLRNRIQTKGLFRTMELIFFQAICKVEYKLLSYVSKELHTHKEEFDISKYTHNETLYLTPIFSKSGVSVRYSEEDIDKVKALGLDIIIRGNAQGIFRGEIINASKEGIISFHHGDNRWNRGGPAGFWEVFLRKPSTGFILQILSEDLDGGSVIFRGSVRTRRSYSENMVHLFNNSNPYLAKVVLEYAKTGRLPQAEEELPFGGKLYLTPSLLESLEYVIKTVGLFSSMAIKRLLFRMYPRWGVAFSKGDWQGLALRRGIRIQNPPKHFFADPFVVTREDRTICYVEDYCYEKQKGYIAAIELLDAKEYRILGRVIEEEFHMSFPFVFEYQGELYMVPETSENKDVRLYKCVEYPMKWVYQKSLLSDIRALDSIIYEDKGVWWLLCTVMEEGKSDDTSSLYAFYSDNPLSTEWIAHEANPLVVDSMIGRNGGILYRNGSVVRVRQEQGFNQYGKAFSLAQITSLTPSNFSEKELARYTPEFFENIKGSHHMHSNGEYTVYDYMKSKTLW